MSTFEHRNLEVPQHSPWHVFTGTIVLTGGFFCSVMAFGWLLM